MQRCDAEFVPTTHLQTEIRTVHKEIVAVLSLHNVIPNSIELHLVHTVSNRSGCDEAGDIVWWLLRDAAVFA